MFTPSCYLPTMVKSLASLLPLARRGRTEEATPAPDLGRIFPWFRAGDTPSDRPAEPAPVPDTDVSDAACGDEPAATDRWFDADLKALSKAWTALRPSEPGEKQVRALFIAAHNLRGAGLTYGRPAVTRLCASLCTLLESDVSRTDYALINLHVEACLATRRHPALSPAMDELTEAVCSALEGEVLKRTARF